MIDGSTLLAFTLLNMSFALVPGPDVLCILSNAITRGAGAGVKVCLGIATACLVHVAAASLGLSALLLAVPTAFLIVKAAGAIYLVWLGWQMMRHPVLLHAEAAPSRWRSPFTQGVLSNLFNPKIAIFFLAILPQFVHPENGQPGVQALILGLVSIASGTAVNLVTATLGARARAFFVVRQKAFGRFQQAAGAALVGLGLRVALERAK
ncbi:LysE family translocator [Rhodoferax sp.]|uniref:LysE family translocator n=1 Tax=Rhodoferax sp. TaxID=50421 RepID=UPI00262A7727|nr:LysE family translocator [Rhodoferax sp.]MDD2923818.1 LysE family translocator [Rhodoferax sp.]